MRVLIFVAHADDETLGAGGWIPKLIKKGYDIHIVLASNGIIDARGKDIVNINHFEEACKFFGITNYHVLGLEDQYFDKYYMADIANSVSKLKIDPDLIITHVDTDLNADHRIICEAAKVIGRPSRKPISILGCEIPNTTAWNANAFRPTFYVDITDTLEQKVEAFTLYKNEIRPFPYPYSFEGIRTVARFRGMEAGFQAAEAYSVIRMFDSHIFLTQ